MLQYVAFDEHPCRRRPSDKYRVRNCKKIIGRRRDLMAFKEKTFDYNCKNVLSRYILETWEIVDFR